MSRKTRSFGQLLLYINEPNHTGQALLQNLHTTADDLEIIEAELLGNSRLLPTRKNGNYLYHEILSFGVDDAPLVTPAIMEDLTRTYLSLRAPYALAYAKAHTETANPHVHLLISANNVASSKRLRLSRQEFQQVKKKLERYQREHYPQLEHSVVFEKTKSPRRKHVRHRRSENERSRRLQKEGKRTLSRKEEIQSTVLADLTTASSGEELYLRLKARGLRLYRRGRSVAVEDLSNGRRFRLRTLGIEETFSTALAQWQAVPQRLHAIQGIQRSGARQHILDTGVREELQRLFNPEEKNLRRSREKILEQMSRKDPDVREPP